jgi:hypothetical protein
MVAAEELGDVAARDVGELLATLERAPETRPKP